MSLPSIRGRLSGLLVAVALCGALLVAAALWLTLRDEVDELLDETLQASAEVLAGLLDQGVLPTQEGAVTTADAARRPRPQEHFAWQLVGPGGQVLLRSARAPAQPWLPLPTPGHADAPSGWRLYGLPLADGQRLLYVGQSAGERAEAEFDVVMTAVWCALAIGLLGAWWLRRRVRRELQPLEALAQALARYEPLQPQVPLPAPTRRELVPVHRAIEALGQRLARRVANERAFSAHAAHALRTPLAGIDTQLAVAEREAPDALQPRLQRARAAAGRLTRVVSALLALFRSGAELQLQTVDLHALLARLPHDALKLRLEGASVLNADADLLMAALINLLDNAQRHGAAEVVVTQTSDARGRCLRLQDDGQGTPPERRADLAEALASQDYEGRTGLGLMLADLVARAHGGALHLPTVERGFAVDLCLGPAPPATTSTASPAVAAPEPPLP